MRYTAQFYTYVSINKLQLYRLCQTSIVNCLKYQLEIEKKIYYHKQNIGEKMNIFLSKTHSAAILDFKVAGQALPDNNSVIKEILNHLIGRLIPMLSLLTVF